MAIRSDIFSFLNARYPRASVRYVMVPAKQVCSREAHVQEMHAWVHQNGEGRYTFLPDSADIHWTTVQGYYDIPLEDWIKARESHEMFLFTHVDTAFAFKLRFA